VTINLLERFADSFLDCSAADVRVFRAPGRVNLIGEHTDYNDGFVLPAAIGFETRIACATNHSQELVIHSLQQNQTASFSVSDPAPKPRHDWTDYVRGVQIQLARAGYSIGGANLLIDGQVPIAAGLSSSAALEVASALALLHVAGGSLDPVSVAKLCQRAENEFVGARCGIMDQFASLKGLAGHAILLDCRSLEARYVPIPKNAALVIANTMVKHSIASGEYQRRREECEEAVQRFKLLHPEITHLRDVSEEALQENRTAIPDILFRRCKHVISENRRVLAAADALKNADLVTAGHLMYESHASLRDDYQVSCPELDLMVELAKSFPGTHGSRMTGGGFGGCTVSLVERDSVAEFKTHVAKQYERVTKICPEIYLPQIVDGAGPASWMSDFPLNSVSHRRLNPLTGEWVLVSPQRLMRPWQGQTDEPPTGDLPSYDPSCYLCPGNVRAGGARNPKYASTFVFDNDFSALQAEIPKDSEHCEKNDFIVAVPERGICRVGCFSPRHDLTLACMSVDEIEAVVEMWVEQCKDLSAREFVHCVQIFENHGAMMGASNPHPHCQIWGTESLPNEIEKEQNSLLKYFQTYRSCLLCDYAEYEFHKAERLVFRNDQFIVVVPFWAVWPFETMVISQLHVQDLDSLPTAGRRGLARTLQRVTRCYDQVFDTPFPYSMGFHQQPVKDGSHREWHLHAHFYPPLLRSATIRKFMVGFEMLGTPQRDISAESVAERLREICSGIRED
jgi:UDPglucose--hexose-1-phosphate uridylyltransferase